MGPSTHSLSSGSGEKPGVGICTCLVTAHYISQGELDSDKTSGTNIHAMACFTSKGIVGCWGQIHCHQGREKGPGDTGDMSHFMTIWLFFGYKANGRL